MVAQTQAAQSASLPHSTDLSFIHRTHLLYCYSAHTQIYLQWFTYNDVAVEAHIRVHTTIHMKQQFQWEWSSLSVTKRFVTDRDLHGWNVIPKIILKVTCEYLMSQMFCDQYFLRKCYYRELLCLHMHDIYIRVRTIIITDDVMPTEWRSFAVVIAIPQLKCTSNERGSMQNSSRAHT